MTSAQGRGRIFPAPRPSVLLGGYDVFVFRNEQVNLILLLDQRMEFVVKPAAARAIQSETFVVDWSWTLSRQA
jgi:hypothetical protein